MGLKYRCVPTFSTTSKVLSSFCQDRSGVKSLISSALYAIRDAARAAVDNLKYYASWGFSEKD